MSTHYVPSIEKLGWDAVKGQWWFQAPFTADTMTGHLLPSHWWMLSALAAPAHKLDRVHTAILSLIKTHTFQSIARDLKTM